MSLTIVSKNTTEETKDIGSTEVRADEGDAQAVYDEIKKFIFDAPDLTKVDIVITVDTLSKWLSGDRKKPLYLGLSEESAHRTTCYFNLYAYQERR